MAKTFRHSPLPLDGEYLFIDADAKLYPGRACSPGFYEVKKGSKKVGSKEKLHCVLYRVQCTTWIYVSLLR